MANPFVHKFKKLPRVVGIGLNRALPNVRVPTLEVGSSHGPSVVGDSIQCADREVVLSGRKRSAELPLVLLRDCRRRVNLGVVVRAAKMGLRRAARAATRR